MAKGRIFDDDKVTELVIRYNSNGRDPQILGEIFLESNNLISVIAIKYCDGDDDLKEELMQEARMQLVNAITRFDHTRTTTLFSFMSAVIKNRMVDVVRKFKPEYDIEEAQNVTSDEQSNEDDYVGIIVDSLRRWFVTRFPSMVKPYLATEILECIVHDLINTDVGKRKAINYLINDYGYSRADARILHEACVVKLRSNAESYGIYPTDKNIPENSLHPEFLEIAGDEVYRDTSVAFSGLGLKFDELEGNG